MVGHSVRPTATKHGGERPSCSPMGVLEMASMLTSTRPVNGAGLGSAACSQVPRHGFETACSSFFANVASTTTAASSWKKNQQIGWDRGTTCVCKTGSATSHRIRELRTWAHFNHRRVSCSGTERSRRPPARNLKRSRRSGASLSDKVPPISSAAVHSPTCTGQPTQPRKGALMNLSVR
jgi:hypothetical protein